MDYEALRANNVDIDGALNRFCDNKELFEKYILKFPEDNSFPELAQAVSDNDYDKMESSVHSLKGVSGTLGINLVYEASCKMLLDLRKGNKAEGKALFTVVKKEYDNIVNVIKQLNK